MEAYYDSGYGRRPEKPRRSPVMWIADSVLTLLTAAAGAAMLLLFFVPRTDPSRVWFFPLLGLAAPAVYMAAVMLMLYWIIRWRLVRAGIMLFFVLAGLTRVSLFWRPQFRRDYAVNDYGRGAFKVVSYNVRGFYGDDKKSRVDSVLDLLVRENPDIVCIQEFNSRLADKSEAFVRFAEKYGQFRPAGPADSTLGPPMLILSRYDILRSGYILQPATSIWVDVLIGGDTVRVFSNHLHSTAITSDDNDYLTNRRFILDTAREEKIRSMADRLRENSVLRAGEADTIARVIAASPRRRIVCGDFNDTPVSYVYRTMAQGLRDAFSECGSGYSHTYRGFFNTLRIDYVFSSDGLEALSYEVPDVDYSDHHPVVVRMKKSN